MEPNSQKISLSVKKRFLKRYYSSNEARENLSEDRNRNFQNGTGNGNEIHQNTSQKKKRYNLHDNCLVLDHEDQSDTSQERHILRYQKARPNTTQTEKHVLQIKPLTFTVKNCILQRHPIVGIKRQNFSMQLKYKSHPDCSRAEFQQGVGNGTEESQQLSKALISALLQVKQLCLVSFQQVRSLFESRKSSEEESQQNENLFIFQSTTFLNAEKNVFITLCYNLKNGFEPYVLIGNMCKILPMPMTVFQKVLSAIKDIDNGYSYDTYY